MMLADAGYAVESGDLQRTGAPAGSRPVVALGREDKRQRAVNAKSKSGDRTRWPQWLRTPEGRAHYRRRKAIPNRCSAGSSRCWGSDPSACADSVQRTRSGK